MELMVEIIPVYGGCLLLAFVMSALLQPIHRGRGAALPNGSRDLISRGDREVPRVARRGEQRAEEVWDLELGVRDVPSRYCVAKIWRRHEIGRKSTGRRSSIGVLHKPDLMAKPSDRGLVLGGTRAADEGGRS